MRDGTAGKALRLPLTVVTTAVIGAALAPEVRADSAAQGRALAAELRTRGETEAEVQLALAEHLARAGELAAARQALETSRRRGVRAFRADLVLADVQRREGRFAESLALLGRVIVEHGGPRALVQAWKTLYEAQLRGGAAGLDVTALRDRLLAEGLYLPAELAASNNAAARSERSTVAAYDALLAGNPQGAVELFQEALDAFPGNARAHRGLGIAWARRHELRRAAGAYVLYLALRPHAADAEEVDRALMRYWKRRAR